MRSASAERVSAEKAQRSFVPSLFVTHGSEQRRVAIDHLPFTIGRRTGKDLVLPDARVSRDHAHIEKEENTFYVVDEGSKHGTFVNDTRVLRQQLSANDRIVFGSDLITVVFSPDQSHPSSAREFLSQVIATPVIGGGSDLEKLTLFLEAAR